MALPVYRSQENLEERDDLRLNPSLVVKWLEEFLRQECGARRGIWKAVLGLSGGVDSAVVAALLSRALSPENIFAYRLPYKLSSQESLDHAQLVADEFGINLRTISITPMVDGYIETEPEISSQRIGNVCARCRMSILFDQAAKLGALPIGTGNKSERLFGYFTWHADDTPPINPLGDLFKTQVWQIAKELGVPDAIISKPATADLVQGQTDEGDFGITYAKADQILSLMTSGYPKQKLIDMGFETHDVELVWSRVAGTHWKRRLPTVAMLSNSAIGEYYLRPVDY